MKTGIIRDEKIVGSRHYRPAVAIILPFEPMMSRKAELEHAFKQALEKVESELMAHYPAEKAIPVLLKLHHLVYNINYNTHKKSVAIFVSPLVEKVYYLDIPVEEKVIIDDSFEIRDLIISKKQNVEFLVMLLSAEKSKMFLGSSSKCMLIKSNVPDHISAQQSEVPKNASASTDPVQEKEMLLAQFLRCMDDDLSIILQAYNLPVFVLGPEKILEQFKSISKHSEKLVEFIEGNYSDAVETEIRKTLEPYLTDWKKVKHRNLLKQIKGSIDNGKVALGIHGVWQAASKRNGRLLIVEKDFIYAALHGGGEERAILKAGSILNDPFYIKDAVDDVMEKVLEIGGDVELVDNGLLQDYGRIVLIKSY